MAMQWSAALVLWCLACPAPAFGAGGQPDPPLTPAVLIASYSDGRSTHRVVSARPSGAWTPLFPKTLDWRSAEGLAVSAINYRWSLTVDGVRVDVSVFLGEPHQKELSVATATVTPDQPVVIDGSG